MYIKTIYMIKIEKNDSLEIMVVRLHRQFATT